MGRGIIIIINNFGYKKGANAYDKIKSRKKLSIGTRGIGFNWDRFQPSEKKGKFDVPMKNPDTPNIFFLESGNQV